VDIAFNLEAQATLAAEQNRPQRAARLWGAAEAVREAIGAPVPPGYRWDYAPHWAESRATAGEAAFAAAWQAGRRMTLAQAIAYANADDD
jgi:hypothetical protein